MTDGGEPNPADRAQGPASRNLLQQELIRVKARLDRQVTQLIRLNEFSNHLLGNLGERGMSETFAEAIVDVMDLAVVCPSRPTHRQARGPSARPSPHSARAFPSSSGRAQGRSWPPGSAAVPRCAPCASMRRPRHSFPGFSC
jgi:hypothetical protein